MLDGISFNGDHLLYDAKQTVLALHEKGYTAAGSQKGTGRG